MNEEPIIDANDYYILREKFNSIASEKELSIYHEFIKSDSIRDALWYMMEVIRRSRST